MEAIAFAVGNVWILWFLASGMYGTYGFCRLERVECMVFVVRNARNLWFLSVGTFETFQNENFH